MSKRIRRNPYWTFWKVVFAGWLIRYPGKVFRIFALPLGVLVMVIYNAVLNEEPPKKFRKNFSPPIGYEQDISHIRQG